MTSGVDMAGRAWGAAKARASAWRTDAGTVPELVWRAATWLVLGFAAYHAVAGYFTGFDEPLLDRHAFRQTQTAISAYYIAHGGPFFAYETPLFGAPYSAPFEFPLYQWIVAVVNRVTRMPLDGAGRAVSIAFFVATTVPFFRLLRRSEVSAASARLATALLLAAPEYIYWTRAFLIESTALFFSISVLAAGLAFLERPAVDRRLAWLGAAATLAALVKVTTAFGYLVALVVVSLAHVIRDDQRRGRARVYAAYFGSVFVLPALPLLAWTRFADYEKGLNPLTANYITSAALHDWNYGTWAQKTALATWQTLWDHTMSETFGSPVGFVACAALAILAAKRIDVVVALLAGVFSIYAVFTNLHVIHEYYQYSTSALAVAVVGIGIGAAETLTARARPLLVGVATAMLLEALSVYGADYLPAQVKMNRTGADTGNFVKAHTSSSALIVIFGDEWSSLYPYYSERRALMDHADHDANNPALRQAIERSAAAGNALGAVLTCNGERGRSPERAAKLLDHPPHCTSFAGCDVCL